VEELSSLKTTGLVLVVCHLEIKDEPHQPISYEVPGVHQS